MASIQLITVTEVKYYMRKAVFQDTTAGKESLKNRYRDNHERQLIL